MKTRLVLLSLAAAPAAWAHGGPVPPDARWWSPWNDDPVVWLNLAALAALYVFGRRRARARGGGARPAFGRRETAAFAAALAFLLIALVSPLSAFAGELLWVHMVQHMVLMNLAAPLFVLAAPGRALLWALPRETRTDLARLRRAFVRRGAPRYLFWQPALLWTLYAAVLWLWHLPALYEAALRSEAVHDLQHLMFFAASALFWRVLLDPVGRLRLSRLAAVLYLFLTSLHATVLGVFMALAPGPWYPAYAAAVEARGLDTLADQRLAGYIMWMPACAAYAVVAAVLFAGWLREEDSPGRAPVNSPMGAPRASR